MSYAVVNGKLRWGYVFIIGLGFFTTSITWTLYNSYVPIFLRNIIESSPYWSVVLAGVINTFIGFIMILDNIAAITLQPYIGAKSDKTWTKFGRRMPYIMVGIPIAALFFALIPLQQDLIAIILIITIFNIAMALYRAPVVALMPDLIPSEHRSRANGVINFMGGVGAVYGFLIGSYLYQFYGPFITFLTTSVIMIIALIILFIYVKEPKKPFEREKPIGIVKAFREVFGEKEKSGMFMLLAIMFWFFSYNVIETWFTTYGKLVVGIPEYLASRILTGLALMFILFAIPAGIIADKIGRRNTIRIGIVGIIILLILANFTMDVMALFIIFTLIGIFWAMININSIVIVWEIGGEAKLGAYTGLYYFFSQLAAIFGPLLAGVVFDLVGFGAMYPLSIAYMIVALICMMFVKRGEAKESKVEVTEALGEVEM